MPIETPKEMANSAVVARPRPVPIRYPSADEVTMAKGRNQIRTRVGPTEGS